MAAQDGGQPFHWQYGDLDDKNFGIHGRGGILVVVVVFALLIFFTLLCLCSRWACRCHRPPAAVGAASDHRSTFAPQEVTLVVAGLDQDAINSFPVRILGSSADEVQCSICLCSAGEGEKVKVLPGCNHAFHPQCVDAWLKGQPSCPLCRASLIAGSAQPAALV